MRIVWRYEMRIVTPDNIQGLWDRRDLPHTPDQMITPERKQGHRSESAISIADASTASAEAWPAQPKTDHLPREAAYRDNALWNPAWL
jgi:hypothetical protein